MAPDIPDPYTEGTVRRADGRRIAYAEYGRPGAVPVLFIAGAGSGAAMAFGGTLLTERGVRLISVDRPGLGKSDDHDDKTFHSVAADLAGVVEGLVGRPVPIIANSQGAPFALAATLEGVASELLLVSPADEVAHDPVTAQLPPDFRQLVEQVGGSDTAEALRTFAPFTAARLFDMIMSAPARADAAVYLDAGFRERFRRVLSAGFAQGSTGYAGDTVLAMRPWGLDFASVRVPVHIMFGAEDASHSPDHGRTLAARIPGATREVIPEAGGSLLWSHSDLVLDRLLSSPDGRTPALVEA
jgi:pimeloyl-ACP methyl ester carboxylesterase